MTSQLTSVCVCVQVNLLPELMDAFSDAGEGRCRFYLQLTGGSVPGQAEVNFSAVFDL